MAVKARQREHQGGARLAITVCCLPLPLPLCWWCASGAANGLLLPRECALPHHATCRATPGSDDWLRVLGQGFDWPKTLWTAVTWLYSLQTSSSNMPLHLLPCKGSRAACACCYSCFSQAHAHRQLRLHGVWPDCLYHLSYHLQHASWPTLLTTLCPTQKATATP